MHDFCHCNTDVSFWCHLCINPTVSLVFYIPQRIFLEEENQSIYSLADLPQCSRNYPYKIVRFLKIKMDC